jgi:hypothetical protein
MPEEDEFRVELVRGRVVREPLPGARHASLNVRLASRIDAHVRTHDLGITLAEAGFVLSVDPPTVRAPTSRWSISARERGSSGSSTPRPGASPPTGPARRSGC